jgi:hypothetical protein
MADRSSNRPFLLDMALAVSGQLDQHPSTRETRFYYPLLHLHSLIHPFR